MAEAEDRSHLQPLQPAEPTIFALQADFEAGQISKRVV